MGDGERHRGQALGGRVDDHHGVLLPRLARLLVADAAPEVDDLLAAVIGAAGAAQLAAPGEVLGKRLAHGLEAAADVSLDIEHRPSTSALFYISRERPYCDGRHHEVCEDLTDSGLIVSKSSITGLRKGCP